MATATMTIKTFKFLNGRAVDSFDYINQATDDVWANSTWLWDHASYIGPASDGQNTEDFYYHAVCYQYQLPTGEKTFTNVSLPVNIIVHVDGVDSYCTATLSTEAPTNTTSWRFTENLSTEQIIKTIQVKSSKNTLTFSNLNFTTSATYIYLYLQINNRNSWDCPRSSTVNEDFGNGTLTYTAGTTKQWRVCTPYVYFGEPYNAWYKYPIYIYFESSGKWWKYTPYIYK